MSRRRWSERAHGPARLAATALVLSCAFGCGNPRADGVDSAETSGVDAGTFRTRPEYTNVYLVDTDPDPGIAVDTGIGCGDNLVPVAVPSAGDGLSATIEALLAQPDTAGLINVLHQDDFSLDSVRAGATNARIYFSGRLMIGGVCDHPRIAGQLEATARSASAVDSVAFFVNGEPLADYLSLGE